MTRVEHTIEIGPPIGEAFDFLTEPLSDPGWQSNVLDARERPIAVGSEFVETMRFLGRWVEVTCRLTEHEPAVRSAPGSS